MTPEQIHANFKSVLSLISDGKIKNAFEKGQLLIDELQQGSFTDTYNELQQNYRFLLEYFIKGIDDPQRKIVYNRIVARLFILMNELREELLFRNSSNFEYLQKRFFPYRLHFPTVSKLDNSLQYYHSQHQDLSNEINSRKNYEQLLNDVFSIFWLTTTYDSEQIKFYISITSVEYPGRLEKNLAVTALTLNLWRMFDEDKLQLLLDSCGHADVEIKQRSLVGLCFILARYNRFIPYFPQIRNRLILLADDNYTSINFRNIIVQIIGTVETDTITKKLREEILPDIMKVSPLLKDKMEADSLLKSDEWEESNPEWQELLEKSGVQDKLQELTELQMQGADVYMGTFAMLKSFPFFNNISNWFLPFDSQYSAVSELFTASEKNLLSAFINNNALCNSDKYSFCLSILQMPEAQRNGLKHSFKIESEQIAEMAKDEALLLPENYAKNISKQYIQDLFRFFKLYPERKDFSDMFASALFMHRTFLFDILSSSSELKSYVAEFYFAKSQYREAIELFNELMNENEATAALFQKIAYCYQQTTEIKLALDAYLKSDIIQPDNVWTTKKIALCYKLLGDYNKALEYYKHLNVLRPNQQNTLLQIANCYLEIEQYTSALEIYSELENTNNNNLKVQRAIVWCALLSGKSAQARYYSQRIIETEPHSLDYIHAAYIDWSENDIKAVIDNLHKAISIQDSSLQLVYSVLKNDTQKLKTAGIVLNDLNLIWDGIDIE
ncbi:MAG: tetratricopeptide repeat protein [Paludibacter sp.]